MLYWCKLSFLRYLIFVFCQMDPEKGGEESPEPRVDRAGSTEMSTVHVRHLLKTYLNILNILTVHVRILQKKNYK